MFITVEPIFVHKDFEESMSSEIHHIMNVLTDTVGGCTNYSSVGTLISPTPTPNGRPTSTYEEIALKSPGHVDHDEHEFTTPSSDQKVGVEIHNSHLAVVTDSPTPSLCSAHKTGSSWT